LGVAVAKLSEKGGDLVGALTVLETDEVLVVMEKGNIVRSAVAGVRLTGRNTQGVKFATPRKRDTIVAVARNVESAPEVQELTAAEETETEAAPAAPATATVPGSDGVPSDESSTTTESSDGDSGGDE
jgi:DNA gyrase subunit A